MSTTETLTMNRILNEVAERRASDIHFVVGNYPFIRVRSQLSALNQEELITPETINGVINFFVSEAELTSLNEKKELKFIYDWLGKARFRVHIFQQKGYFSVSLKLINSQVKKLADLGLPKVVGDFIKQAKGLIFITGPFNSGRSATLNSLLENINQVTVKVFEKEG